MKPTDAAPDVDSRSVFVYFRSRPEHAEEAIARLRLQLDTVRNRTGVAGRSGARTDVGKTYLTWLEIYEGIPAGSLESVLREIDAAALESGLTAIALEGRHREVFTMPAPDGQVSPMV